MDGFRAETTVGDSHVVLFQKGWGFGFYIGIYRETDLYIHIDSEVEAKNIYVEKVRELLDSVA